MVHSYPTTQECERKSHLAGEVLDRQTKCILTVSVKLAAYENMIIAADRPQSQVRK